MSDQKKTVQTPKFRASFAEQLFKAKANNQGTMIYSVQALFTEEQYRNDPAIKEMKKLVEETAIKKFGDKIKNKDFMADFKNPFKSGDKKYAKNPDKYPMYKGMWYCTFSTQNKPGIADKSATSIITDPSEFYSGCWARAKVNAYPFDQTGNYGVALGLQGLQKLGEGERFGFNADPTAMFDSVEGDEPGDADSYGTAEESMFG